MSERLADAAERRRISTELTRSMLVEAGAGSGKTHEMAARMAAGVAAGVYEVPHMVAVTFTRKAAAELRGRFQLALEQELAASAGNAARVARLERALGSIERFFAGTIHAFCARLLRERPVEAGVSPGFSELDDVDERMLRRQVWRDFRAQAVAAGDPDLLRLDAAGISVADLDQAFEAVSLHEDVTFPAPERERPGDDDAWRALESFWHVVETHLPDPIPADTTCPVQQKARAFRRDWRFYGRHGRRPGVFADLLAQWDFTPKITQKWWADSTADKRRINEAVVGAHTTLRDTVAVPWLAAWRESLYAPCVRVLLKARDYAARERRRRSQLSFNDLLLLTARVLRENDEVREALRRKYRYLFVDEFQDTDPIQAEIVHLLTGPAGMLFVVGDPKQSIYRFRRADIDTYNEMRDRLGGGDGSGVVPLTTNFRSVAPICDWANRVFETVFPADPGRRQPRFAPLVPRGQAPPPAAARPPQRAAKGRRTVPDAAGARAHVMTLTIEPDVSSKDACVVEAGRIARCIATEVAAGRRRFEDFLIITRKKKPLLVYAQALEALHVPIEVSGAGAFGESPEVCELAALIGALADPQDGVALVGVLRGALFGLSDRQLFAWREAGGYIGLFSESDDPLPAEAQPVAAALATLRRWFRWTRVLPAGAALDRILEDSGYLALAACSPGGVEAGDVLHAVDRVRAAVEAGFTLAEAAESLGEDADESSEVESLPLEPGRANVVRLMNLHKAKGLEAPVVFLADPLGGFESKVDVRIERGGVDEAAGATGWLPIRKRVGEFGWKMLALPPGWTDHERVERDYFDAEAGRLLYVAATRARDLLVIGRYAGKQGRWPAWHVFEPFLGDVPELDIPAAVSVRTSPRLDLSSAARSAAGEAIADAHARVRPPSWAATSVTAETKQVPRLSPVAADELRADDPTAVVAAETPSRRADAGMAWGALVHGLLEHAMRHPQATRQDLHRLALWLTFEQPALRPVIDQAIDTVDAVKASDRWRAARSSPEHHEEAPFSIAVTGDDGRPTLVNGTIDLVYRDGAVWCIVDYKTDVDRGTVSERYAAQVSAYADAWHRITGDTVTSDVVSTRTVTEPAGH